MPVVVVMVDVTSKNTREHIHPQIMASLQQYSHIPSVLVLNKVSQWYITRMKGSQLLEGGREGEREKKGGERDIQRLFSWLPSTFQEEREKEREERERDRDSTYSHSFPPSSHFPS